MEDSVFSFLTGMHPVLQAFIATCFTWFLTAAGAALVFTTTSVNRKLLDGMLGFAAGVMIAASFWSLLAPAIEMAEDAGSIPWIPAVVGFMLGGITMRLVDIILPHLHTGFATEKAEGITSRWRRTTLLVSAVTLHNFPEGLAVGVAFGAVAAGLPSATIGGAIALAIGIGIQNFPEGAAVSMPMRREGISRRKSFFYGQASGIVEPIAGVIGAYFVLTMQSLLPYALSFAAGAMIFVVVEQLIPESQRNEKHIDFVTLLTLLGFSTMMLLDVALG
ncbi:ZIP family metal transporter [candidate division KSB1 bacterium]